ncbi:MAG: hypothetical protein AB1938_14155 [Myxococcota bacterium]
MSVMSVALCAALAGAPDAGVRKPFEWNVPRLLTIVPVGQRLEANGLPMQIFAARSKESLDNLIIHYAQRFLDDGLFLPFKFIGPRPGGRLPKVVAFDPEAKVSYLVYGWPEPDGTTTLILGAADLGARSQRQTGKYPPFPGAIGVTSFQLEYAEAVSFTAKATEEEVIDFYRSILPAGGWKERERGVFVKEGRAVRVLARPDKAKGVLGVVVLEQADELVLGLPEKGEGK